SDVDGDDRQRGNNQSNAELDAENDADAGELNDGRSDVEQDEIEHHVDALRAPLDDLGQRSGPPFEVEAQRQIVDVPEYFAREPARRVLADLLKDCVADIVRKNPAEPRDC